MNRLAPDKRAAILGALVEGNSIRATCRITGAAKNTVKKLLVNAGKACAAYQDKALRDLPCKRIQVDEIWSFCYAKAANVPKEHRGEFGYGDIWTWVAIDADTKLAPCWAVGGAEAIWAKSLMADLKSRLRHRVQLTTDSHGPYMQAVDQTFWDDIDYAQLRKVFGTPRDKNKPWVKTGPSQLVASWPQPKTGNPDPKYIATSYIERQNLTMRMQMRRFTRLTNGFSKKLENLRHAVALHFMAYNFCRKHKSLKQTPAQAAGVTDKQWTMRDIVGLVGAREEKGRTFKVAG